MGLPKWARMHMAIKRLKNLHWGFWTSLTRDDQDKFERAVCEAWRMGYRAGKARK